MPACWSEGRKPALDNTTVRKIHPKEKMDTTEMIPQAINPNPMVMCLGFFLPFCLPFCLPFFLPFFSTVSRPFWIA